MLLLAVPEGKICIPGINPAVINPLSESVIVSGLESTKAMVEAIFVFLT